MQKNGELATEVDQLKAKDAHLMTKVNTLTQDNTALEKKNGDLASKLNQVENSQTQLKAKDAHLMTKVNEILTKVEGNVKQVGELKSEFVSS